MRAGRLPKLPVWPGASKHSSNQIQKPPGIKLLNDTWAWGVNKLKFDPEAFAYELGQGIIGDLYPVPGRMLRCCERIVHEFLAREMCDGRPPAGKFDIFAVEGGTAAMCYIFDTADAERTDPSR